MKVKFWGVRGTTPTPERRNSRYGGNTSCIEVRLANGTVIILDCGSGLRNLGWSLVQEFRGVPIRACFFLRHLHWDHIQGFPYFLPFYKEGNIFTFHSVARDGIDLKSAIESQMRAPYFPVSPDAIKSTHYYRVLKTKTINVNGAVITHAPMNHPQGCIGYRIEADGSSFVLATDTEPASPFHDQCVRELAKEADLLVYDAQYTPERTQRQKKGCGHSSWREGAGIAKECGVKRLLLFHHDPESDDVFIDGLVERARAVFPNVAAAAEGSEIRLPAGEVSPPAFFATHDRRRERRYRLEVPLKLSWLGSNGKPRVSRGFCQDFSKSGMFFLAAGELETDQRVDVEVVLPEEITGRGDVLFRSRAHLLRRNPSSGTLKLAAAPAVGVAARLSAVQAGSAPKNLAA